MDLYYQMEWCIDLVNSEYKCCISKKGADHDITVLNSGWVLDFKIL